MRVFRAFWLQLHFWCSNLRVAEIPCFAGSTLGRPEQGYLFEQCPDGPSEGGGGFTLYPSLESCEQTQRSNIERGQ
jgi:hypothetical protein